MFTTLKVQLITVSIRSNRMLKKTITASKNQTEKYAATDYERILNELKMHSKKYNVRLMFLISKR